MISVIVPVYNTAPYLDRCIASIAAQSERDLEILLIDDGSTDGSAAVLDAWAEKDSRIRVVHKERNSGVSDSRNIGLGMARGEYIGFVDSDDWIEEDMYASLLRWIREKDADIAFCGYSRSTQSGDQTFLPEMESGTVLDREQFLAYCMPLIGAGTPNMFVYNKLYSRSCVEKDGEVQLFDTHYSYCEDILWLIGVMMNCRRAVVWKGAGYNYFSSREGNTWTAISSFSNMKYCQNAMKANTAIWRTLRDAGSASQQSAHQRVLYYRRFALRTAAAQHDQAQYREYADGYIGDLLKWAAKNRTVAGVKWTARQLASHLKFRLTHPSI